MPCSKAWRSSLIILVAQSIGSEPTILLGCAICKTATNARQLSELRVSVQPIWKTKAAKRRVPLTLAAKTVLGQRMKSEGTYLFPCETDDARPIPKVNNAHDRAVRDSKVASFRLYDLRHTWATRAAMSGIDLVTLAAMLGHSRIQMVLRYAHPTQEHQHQAMERLEEFVATERAKAQKKKSSADLSKRDISAQKPKLQCAAAR
jgi:Phage integrase family